MVVSSNRIGKCILVGRQELDDCNDENRRGNYDNTPQDYRRGLGDSCYSHSSQLRCTGTVLNKEGSVFITLPDLTLLGPNYEDTHHL